MKISYNVAGGRRKALAEAVGKITQTVPVYKRMPTCAYEIGDVTVDKDGNLICGDEAKAEYISHELLNEGFTPVIDQPTTNTQPTDTTTGDQPAETTTGEQPTTDTQPADTTTGDQPVNGQTAQLPFTISIPREGFTDTAIELLTRQIANKSELIKKALGAARLTVEVRDNAIAFPWFDGCPSPEEILAYTEFITKLTGMVRTQKRVNSGELPPENEKYAFRCYLLRLGFIGPEYKSARKLLLRNLTGSSAFRKERSDEQ